MKRTLKLLALGIIISIGSCKKGENDPFLSLKSRDARICGTWVLKSSEATTTYSYKIGTNTVSGSNSSKFDGSLLTKVWSGGSTSISYSEEISINKDGTYQHIIISDGNKQEYKGYWNWMNDKKNKTSIFFDYLGSFRIDQLKNKEMILVTHYIDNETEANGDFDNSERMETLTYTKK